MTTGNSEPIRPEAERQAYDKLKEFQPPKEVAPPESGQKLGLGEAMEMSEDLSDFQAAIRILHPPKRKPENVRVGRIDPGVFLSSLHLKSVDEIMRHDPSEKIDVMEIYMNNYVDLSIGLDGKGIIDVAELLGAAKEEKRAKELLMGKGIP